MSHALIAPSSAHVWGKPDGCTGSVLFVQAFPDPGRPEADEGTLVHKISQTLIHSLVHFYQEMGRDHFVDQMMDGIFVTDEMYDSAMMYARDVAKIAHSVERPPRYFGIEQKVQAVRIHPTHSFGTVDCYLYDEKTKTLYVWDFKFGHVIREAFESWQMINYAAGILDLLGLDREEITIRLRLVQPRAYHRSGTIREWKTTHSELIPYFNSLRLNAWIALSDKATLRSGAHCIYCPARHACKAALDAGSQLYEVASQSMPQILSPEELAVQYSIIERAFDHLKSLKIGYEQRIKSLMRSGKNIPGYHLTTGRGKEVWAKPAEEVTTMGDFLETDLRKTALVTPNQARKLGIDPGVIRAFSKRTNTGTNLERFGQKEINRVFHKGE